MTAVAVTAAPTTTVDRPAPIAATAVEKIPVYLQTDAQDAMGAAYVARLREALNGSRIYEAVAHAANARFVVGILTMDPNEAAPGSSAGRSTVAAITLQRGNPMGLNAFVYSWVLVARPDNVDSLATELLAAIGKEIQDFEGVTLQPADAVR